MRSAMTGSILVIWLGIFILPALSSATEQGNEEAPPNQERAEEVVLQAMSGTIGGLAIAAIPIAILYLSNMDVGLAFDFIPLKLFLLGGYAAGSAVGVWAIGDDESHRGSMNATTFGAIAGTVGGALVQFPYAVLPGGPVVATIAYQLTRRAIEPAAPSGGPSAD